MYSYRAATCCIDLRTFVGSLRRGISQITAKFLSFFTHRREGHERKLDEEGSASSSREKGREKGREKVLSWPVSAAASQFARLTCEQRSAL